MALREFCESRLEYVLDDDITSLEAIEIRPKSNILLVERISNTDHIKGTDLKVVKMWNKAGHSERIFKVVRCSDSLFFDPRHRESVLYDTDMEVSEGDVVVLNTIESLNSFVYKFKDRVYHTVKYDNIICKLEDGKPIPVNGFVLVSSITKTHKWGTYENKFNVPNEGIVEALGMPNRDYRRNYHPGSGKLIKGRRYSDKGYEEMEVGDRVLLSSGIAFTGTEQGASIYPLEAEEHRTLDKMYYVAQRPKIGMIMKKDYANSQGNLEL